MHILPYIAGVAVISEIGDEGVNPKSEFKGVPTELVSVQVPPLKED